MKQLIYTQKNGRRIINPSKGLMGFSGVARNFRVMGNFLVNFFEEWAILGNQKSIGL
jgi:hypothetical protein